MSDTTCELCRTDGGQILYRNQHLRIVLVDDPQYPGFCRVIWNDHIREMTDLALTDRQMLMEAVWACETAIRTIIVPDKINLASLGNLTPHLHWHVIPRFTDDPTFPSPIWATAIRRGLRSTDTSLQGALTEAILVQLGKDSRLLPSQA